VPAVRDHHQGYTHAVFVLSDGFMLALHAHGATDPNHSFDEFRPGLDHISFACADRNEVERWQERLEELGIKHGGIAEDANGFGLSFRDPDGVALEFWTPSPQLSPANG
jgi:catechol 2,3-dioxygenase-like lactoylglutathione lyase family enzyme